MILYKYYSDAKYNFEALLNENFFFSKTCKLNDPFDASFQLVKPYKLSVLSRKRKFGVMNKNGGYLQAAI